MSLPSPPRLSPPSVTSCQRPGLRWLSQQPPGPSPTHVPSPAQACHQPASPPVSSRPGGDAAGLAAGCSAAAGPAKGGDIPPGTPRAAGGFGLPPCPCGRTRAFPLSPTRANRRHSRPSLGFRFCSEGATPKQRFGKRPPLPVSRSEERSPAPRTPASRKANGTRGGRRTPPRRADLGSVLALVNRAQMAKMPGENNTFFRISERLVKTQVTEFTKQLRC